MNDLDLLWSLLPHPSPDSVVRLFARIGDLRYGDFARSPTEMERFIASKKNSNIYLAPNPTCRTTGIRHTASDVTHWSWIFFDIDPVCTCYVGDDEKKHVCDTCQGKADPWKAMDVALGIFGDLMYRDFWEKKSVLRIDSGRGMQAWIRLDDVPLVDTALDPSTHYTESYSRKVARKAMGYWLSEVATRMGTQYGCRLDTSVSDLPRVMRMPGTVNQKTGKEAKILIPSSEVFHGLAFSLVHNTPSSVFIEEPARELAAGTPWQVVFSSLTMKAQNYLMYGKDPPNRHETMWHTLVKLKECGIDREEAKIGIVRANALRGKDYELDAKDVFQVLTQVYGES